MDHIDELAETFARFPSIGPRQGKRFVYYLLAASTSERTKLAELISSLGKNVRQCQICFRYYNGNIANVCNYCADKTRDNTLLMIIEKDQDLTAVERAQTYKGRYFVLGGVLTLSGKGSIREKELVQIINERIKSLDVAKLEVVLALSATSEGEHTSERVRELLTPYRDYLKISELGRGLATGSELEYSDAETIRAALKNRNDRT